MAVNPTHGLQRADAENQESETSPNESAKENEHWFTLLEKNRLQAYQHLQRYITAQQGHVQLDDADPLIPNLIVGQEELIPHTTEEDVQTSLQALRNIFPQLRADIMGMIFVELVMCFVVTIIESCIFFLSPLHESDSAWTRLLWLPSELFVAEALWDLYMWFLVGRCISRTIDIQTKLEQGRLRLKDKNSLQGWVWRAVGYTRRIKVEGQGPSSEQEIDA